MVALTRLGKYEIRRELGKGAMGVVYEGFDPLIERTVAIKTILPARLNSAESADVLARFKREAQAAGRLNHPHIVAIYDYGEVVVADDEATVMRGPGGAAVVPAAGPAPAGEQVAFIAMEFVKGRELRDFFEGDERFALPEVSRLMGEMLDALAHAHANGVVHRDMKPANLIILDNGKLKVADFGIARVEASQLTQAGTVMGTPSYMSPEQFQGQTVDGRSDLFSCGVILYQFLTGEKPFTGSTTTIMYKVLREEPVPPSALNTTLPPALDAVVSKALAKNPAQRYQTAAEFSGALQDAISGLDALSFGTIYPAAPAADATVGRPAATATPATQPLAQPAPARATTQAVASAPTATEAKAKSKAPMLVALAAVVAVLGSGAYLLLASGRGAAPAQVAQGAAPAATPGAAGASVAATTAPAAVVAAAPAPVAPAAPEPAAEPGTMIISALSVVDPKDARFNGDAAAAQTEVRSDARRQLVQKALALYVERASLDKNQAALDRTLLSNPGSFIKTVILEGAANKGANGLLETETRAVVKVRDVQKSLNQLSREERIDFIRRQGDPRVALQMAIRVGDGAQALPPERSQLAENVLKQRIKSFGFRVWSADGEVKTGDKAQAADFVVQGEVRLKQLSAKLEASGLTITKTVLTSWTIKAIDKSTGEEIYLNTVMPKNQSWGTEEQALADIGKQVGDEFSKNFFLQHFSYGTQKTSLIISGLPDPATAGLLLRELRASKQVIDVQPVDSKGRFTVQLPEGNPSDIVQDAIVAPINAKLGQACLALAGATSTEVSLSFAATCATAETRARLEALPPAGLQAPAKASKTST